MIEPLVLKLKGADDAEKFITVMELLLPPTGVFRATIEHDDECPCADGERGMDHCTCDEVVVTMEDVTPGTEEGSHD